MKISTAILSAAAAVAASTVTVPTVTAFTATRAVPRTTTATTRLLETVANGEATSETTFRGAEAISAKTKDVGVLFDSTAVDKFLPHRYPFALVDKIVEMEGGKRAVGIKAVTKNEDFFNGHFPGQPVMPGVLQLEAMAQLAGCVVANDESVPEGSVYFFGSADGVKWKKPVVPGDVLVMEVEITKFNKKFGIIKATGKAYVDGKLAVEVAEMTL
jgi:3-hydroxyacyl-[acyl-carrier-protein] dehydratase